MLSSAQGMHRAGFHGIWGLGVSLRMFHASGGRFHRKAPLPALPSPPQPACPAGPPFTFISFRLPACSGGEPGEDLPGPHYHAGELISLSFVSLS